jgi:hypothetical protein
MEQVAAAEKIQGCCLHINAACDMHKKNFTICVNEAEQQSAHPMKSPPSNLELLLNAAKS